MERYIQFTSGKGPAECNLALELAFERFQKEAHINGIQIEVASSEKDGKLFCSIHVKLRGNELQSFLSSWLGTILWIYKSPFRPSHKRKNWFVAVLELSQPENCSLQEGEIRFESMRSSGPGGQHVNKTSTAIRATHLVTGITVQVMDTRSQLQNKRLAIERLKEKMQSIATENNLLVEKGNWINRTDIERGNPIRTFTGKDFKEVVQ